MYWQAEPWGEVRADARALFATNRINASGGTLPYRERLEYDECVLEQYREPPPTVEEIQQVMSDIEARRQRVR